MIINLSIIDIRNFDYIFCATIFGQNNVSFLVIIVSDINRTFRKSTNVNFDDCKI